MSLKSNKVNFRVLFLLLSFVVFVSLFMVTNPVITNAATAWAAGIAYKVGDQVTYNGLTYQCLQAHTSLVGWEPPNVPALWKLISSASSTPTASKTPTPTTTTTATNTPTPTVTSTATPTPTGASNFLKASGTQMKKNYGTGSVVNLHGVNLGGWLLQENWMSPLGCADEWTLRQTLTSRFGESTKESLIGTYQDTWIQASDLDNIKNMGMNFVRVPVLYLDLMDASGNWKTNPWTKLDWLVSQCSSRGIYILLDLHGTFGGQNTFDNCGQVNSAPQLWVNNQYQNWTVALWQGIAAHFKGNPTVAGYDLLNEPDKVSASQLNAFYNRLYQSIRAIDPDHTIYLEAAWDWNQLYAPSTYGWTNVVYELHYYAMATGQSTDWDAQNGLINSALQGIRDHQSWNVPIYAGEYCLYDFTDLWGSFMANLNQLGVQWTNWTYKVTGGGNWGYYNNSTGSRPDITTESASSISSKWLTFDTAGHFTSNTSFQNVVKQYTGGSTTPPSISYSSIKAMANNNFVSADNYGQNPLLANKTTVGTWESFQVINNSDGTISLLSKENHLYVTVDLNNSSNLIASRTTISTWEKFKLINNSNGTVSLLAMANNMYVSADLNTSGVLIANRATASTWEQFVITKI